MRSTAELTGIPGERLFPSITYLDTEEAAAFLRVQPYTLRRWRSDGVGPKYFKPETGKVLYRQDDLISHVEGKK